MSTKRTVPDPAGRSVKILAEPVARKIAAGEVIDRPYAAVRELLDNALDAGADEITVSLLGGGVNEVRITDNGCGMSAEDLELCWLAHATSKITSVEDLESAGTLGFRGEALASLAACSRLEMVSSRKEGEAYGLEVHGGKKVFFGQKPGGLGTVVSVRDLFFNLPARRRFLKTSRAESGLCRRVFLEKAAAHPERTFRFFSEDSMKIYLPGGTPAERIMAAWPSIAPESAWWETRGEGDGFEFVLVHARPEINRRDRQYIQIYVNGRRIDEFSLVQAVQYAYDNHMPGGAFPLAFVFIDIDPVLADFNIHPAKKEARFRDIQSIRHRIIDSLKDRLLHEAYQRRTVSSEPNFEQSELPAVGGPNRESGTCVGYANELSGDTVSEVSDGSKPFNPSAKPGNRGDRTMVLRWTDSPVIQKPSRSAAALFGDAATSLRNSKQAESSQETNSCRFHYLGRAMGVFLVAERSKSLYIVDQHAAHERILFDEYRKTPPVAERLLIPRPLELDDSARMKLELRRERLEAIGLEFEIDSKGRILLISLPQAARGMENEIAEFLETGAGDAEGMEKDLWANLSCKAAVKDNSILDDTAACVLLEKVFALEIPRCPHGRPIWFEISRSELFSLVGRTV